MRRTHLRTSTLIPKRCIRRIQNEIKLIQSDPIDGIKVCADENNILEWYFVLHDIKSDQYENGVYLGKINLPPEYPMKPPKFQMLTPSGRFNIGEDICTTFTNYHGEKWSAKWNIQGMVLGLLSFMLDDAEHGVASIQHNTSKERRTIASRSMVYNLKYYSNIFETMFPEFINQ